MSELEPGQSVPDFSMPTDSGDTVSRDGLKGQPFVLYFYPKDDTSGCTKEAQAFTGLAADFAALGVRVIGVSRDSVTSHAKFRAKYALGVLLASDPENAVIAAFGSWVEKSMYGKKYMGIDRSTFLVDANGTLVKAWRKVKVPGHAEDVLAAARAL